jgi:hypothetical protein
VRNLFRYIIISAFLLTSVLLYAEEKPQKDAGSFNKNRISLAYGYMSAPRFGYQMGIIIVDVISYMFSSDIEEETYTSFGPLSFTYDRNISKHLSFGVMFSYEYFKSEQTFTDGETKRVYYNLFTVMPKVTLRWGWEVVSFYHGISSGAALWHTGTEDSSGETNSYNDVTLAIHLYLFGININIGDTVSLFGDYGGGFLGMINIGMALDF